MTPLEAIHEKCVECCDRYAEEIKFCPCKKCPLHPYRMGKRPTSVKDIPQKAASKKPLGDP